MPWEASSAEHLRPMKINFSMGSKHLPFCLHEEIQCSPQAGSRGDHGNLLCWKLPWIAALLARAGSESLQPTVSSSSPSCTASHPGLSCSSARPSTQQPKGEIKTSRRAHLADALKGPRGWQMSRKGTGDNVKSCCLHWKSQLMTHPSRDEVVCLCPCISSWQ